LIQVDGRCGKEESVPIFGGGKEVGSSGGTTTFENQSRKSKE
jgi:hypothetical protein